MLSSLLTLLAFIAFSIIWTLHTAMHHEDDRQEALLFSDQK